MRFVPEAHPGARAPLGWARSDRTMTDLRIQLDEFNRQGIQEVRGWLTDELQCR
jgi:hypothetical protein